MDSHALVGSCAQLGLRYPDDIGQAISNIVRIPEFTSYLSSGEFAEPLIFAMSGQRKAHLQVVVTRFAEGDVVFGTGHGTFAQYA